MGTLPGIPSCQQELKKTPPNKTGMPHLAISAWAHNFFPRKCFEIFLSQRRLCQSWAKNLSILFNFNIKNCTSCNFTGCDWMFLPHQFSHQLPCNFDWHVSVQYAWQSSMFATCIIPFDSHSICVCRCINWASERCDNFPNVVITDRMRITPQRHFLYISGFCYVIIQHFYYISLLTCYPKKRPCQ